MGSPAAATGLRDWVLSGLLIITVIRFPLVYKVQSNSSRGILAVMEVNRHPSAAD